MAHASTSGTQHPLRAGKYEAVIASVGASLRTLQHAGRDLVVPFEASQVRPAYRGATLAPWPNRVVDGRYMFRGEEQILAHTEPSRGHALHGLAGWLDFEAIDEGPAHVTLTAVIQPQAGYPWRVAVTTTYALGADGLTQEVTAANESDAPAPFGTGPHPYLVAGRGQVDDWTLELPAREVLEVTAERLVPLGLRAVAGDERFDYVVPRVVGPAELDHAFTAVIRDRGGRATVRLTDGTGSGAAMSWDQRCPWVQIHTADMPGTELHRVGLAVEPMTCAPDAFNSGTDLIVLEPGGSTAASWTISAIEPG